MSQWGFPLNTPSCPVIYMSWKGMWKEWKFWSYPLIDNGNVQLHMENCVDRTFGMDDGNMLLRKKNQREIS